MTDGPRAVAEAYWRDESARDIDGVMSHYHADAELVEPGGRRRMGHDDIRAYYEASAAGYPGLWVEILAELVIGDRAALEWRAELTAHDGTRIPGPRRQHRRGPRRAVHLRSLLLRHPRDPVTPDRRPSGSPAALPEPRRSPRCPGRATRSTHAS